MCDFVLRVTNVFPFISLKQKPLTAHSTGLFCFSTSPHRLSAVRYSLLGIFHLLFLLLNSFFVRGEGGGGDVWEAITFQSLVLNPSTGMG